MIRTLPRSAGRIQAVALGSSGELLATGGEDQVVRVWNLNTGVLERSFIGYSNPIWSISPMPSDCILTCSEDGVVRSWTVSGNPQVAQIFNYTSKRVRTAIYDEAAGEVIAGGDSGRIMIFPGNGGRPVRVLTGHIRRVTALAFTSEHRIVSASGDGTIKVWDRSMPNFLSSMSCGKSGQNALAAARLANFCYVGGDDGVVRKFDLDTMESAQTESIGARIWSLDISPADAELAVGASDGTIRTLVADGLRHQYVLRGHVGWVWCVRYLDGNTLLSSAEDGVLAAWSLNSQEQFWSVRAHDQRVRSLIVLDDGRVAAVSDDGTVSIWTIGASEADARFWPPRPYEDVRVSRESGLRPDRLTSLAALGAVLVP
jgi:hypothetical protein